jgi:hypothetical protein
MPPPSECVQRGCSAVLRCRSALWCCPPASRQAGSEQCPRLPLLHGSLCAPPSLPSLLPCRHHFEVKPASHDVERSQPTNPAEMGLVERDSHMRVSRAC